MKNTRGFARQSLAIALAAICLLGPVSASQAQLGGLGRVVPGVLGPTTSLGERLGERTLDLADPQVLLNQRLDRLDTLVRAHPKAVERDSRGAPVVRGEILAIAPSAQALAAAREAGFEVAQTADPQDLVGIVVLRAPSGMTARHAVDRLRKLDPAGAYDFNHLYEPAGAVAGHVKPTETKPPSGAAHDVVLGLIDTGLDASAPVFAHARVEQKGFVGPFKPADHGTAVASLMIGEALMFRSAAPGATLYAADVYGAAPAGGSAEAIVRALTWLLDRKVKVVNVSLVGPPNLALGAAVKAVQARGVILVAAVGNDGPAAPPAYPASYPGVVAVTGVDARGRVLIEAGTAGHLDFAAPGADMAAAAVGGGYVAVRGTSFAAPLVAGRLAMLMHGDDPASVIDRLAQDAKREKDYGRGLVAVDLRTPPGAVHARPAPAN